MNLYECEYDRVTLALKELQIGWVWSVSLAIALLKTASV